MSPALRAGSAAAPSRLACCTANARVFAQLRTSTGSGSPPASARREPDNKKAPIAGSLKFKLAEEEGFEPS